MKCNRSLVLIIINLIRITIGQNTNGYDCCSMYMMDASGRVAIETRRTLTSGTFVSLRARACTTDPIAVQIWRLTGNGTLSFRWQTVIYPVLSTATETFMTVNFGTGLVLTSDDRLGLFSPFDTASSMSVLSIPFGFDGANYYLYYTTATFKNFTDFNGSVQVTADDLRWPRSFVGSVFFCQLPGCSDVTIQAQTAPPPSYTSPKGTADQCCPNQMACDPNGVNAPLLNQSQSLQDLNQEVNYITTIIRDLISSRVVTGLCPQGFTAGTYGVGKCFLLIRDGEQMASAALRCQTEYNALMLQIKSVADESFLRDFLSGISASGEVSFWTAGMYNRIASQWFWYDDNLSAKSSFTYSNWRNQVRPIPATDDDVCMKLVVTQGVASSSYWAKADCNEKNYFICQVLKICL